MDVNQEKTLDRGDVFGLICCVFLLLSYSPSTPQAGFNNQYHLSDVSIRCHRGGLHHHSGGFKPLSGDDHLATSDLSASFVQACDSGTTPHIYLMSNASEYPVIRGIRSVDKSLIYIHETTLSSKMMPNHAELIHAPKRWTLLEII